jgi:phosphatidylinositol 4-kinase
MTVLIDIPDSMPAWNLSQKKWVEVISFVTAHATALILQAIRGCINDLNAKAAAQALPENLSVELRALLVGSTHRIEKARDIASKYLNRLITSFPSLMCDPPLVFAILDVLTLLRRGCENEFTDEVCVVATPS